MKYNVYQPYMHGNEKKYVNECLDTSWISSKGHFVDDFEREFSKYIGVKYAAAVSNGTVAIHLALLALDIQEGDEVIVPSLTYVASANPILMVGAKPIFVDSKIDNWQLDETLLEDKITPKTKAIIAVHLYGCPCNMDMIMEIAKKHNLYVIEDCAEAIGTMYKGKKVGSFGDVGCFSFFGNKTITCGEGGMVMSNNKDLVDRMADLKSQGVSKTREYWHEMVAYNYRMTNIQAAIGLAQLEQVDEIIEKKRQIAAWYMDYLKDLPLVFLNTTNDSDFNTYWMCSIKVENKDTRVALRNYMKEMGIETRPSFPAVHKMPMFVDICKEDFEVANYIGDTGMNIPSYPDLTEGDVKNICGVIRDFFNKTR